MVETADSALIREVSHTQSVLYREVLLLYAPVDYTVRCSVECLSLPLSTVDELLLGALGQAVRAQECFVKV